MFSYIYNKVYIIRPTSMPDKRHAQSLLKRPQSLVTASQYGHLEQNACIEVLTLNPTLLTRRRVIYDFHKGMP